MITVCWPEFHIKNTDIVSSKIEVFMFCVIVKKSEDSTIISGINNKKLLVNKLLNQDNIVFYNCKYK